MNKIILIIFLLGILVLGYYIVVFEPNNIKIERQVIAMKNLPRAFDGARIVQLSDIHSLWFGGRERKALEMVKELNPDFVFLTGDLIDPRTKITDNDLSSVKIFWQTLSERHRGRVFGVLGNHDYHIKLAEDYLKMSGIEILDNENQKLWLDNDFIYLVGVDDFWTGKDDLSKAMKGLKENIPKILLTHSPDIIYQAVKQNIDLVLAGHLHGGQVVFPFLGPLWLPSKYGTKYLSGLFEIENTYLYVNRGIGTSILPIRFNCPPEITLIELISK